MIVEFRTYRLTPGTGEEFVRVMTEESAPLQAAAGIAVLDTGVSLVAEEGHTEAYLIRAFTDLSTYKQLEEDFYASEGWRAGPREKMLSMIESYHTIVMETDERTVAALDKRG
ncbi:NIPSNAP family protein [Labedaea rhizosphaerae]|uniref:NIPSNAP protein n=1 Tax=Labedaea rhizosphaerae TaxID=598644 RepID=A0A4R6SC92_LABRH|nr:NIPSNAP family protein [Labedaea rhizosphaerae]TDP97580.1 NIPSNAP protein [Labedaea rhizosphaerae]